MEPDINQPKPKQRRAQVEYKGVPMMYCRAVRIKELTPFLEQANDKGLSIPKAADWMGWSTSTLRNWIRVLGMTWKNRAKRTVYCYDKTGWEDAIKKGFAEGKSQTQIARSLKTGIWNLNRFIHANGLRQPNARERLISNE
jgi:hypothetical protein